MLQHRAAQSKCRGAQVRGQQQSHRTKPASPLLPLVLLALVAQRAGAQFLPGVDTATAKLAVRHVPAACGLMLTFLCSLAKSGHVAAKLYACPRKSAGLLLLSQSRPQTAPRDHR
jgi:hypothetical protein